MLLPTTILCSVQVAPHRKKEGRVLVMTARRDLNTGNELGGNFDASSEFLTELQALLDRHR
ncbi:MAG: hypothetical protein AAFY80_07030 [Pseudomonadota bacterium]